MTQHPHSLDAARPRSDQSGARSGGRPLFGPGRLAALTLVIAILLAGTSALAAGTAPVLTSTSPANTASVQSAPTVSAAYDQALSTASTLVVSDNTAVAIAGSSALSPDATTIVFTPASPLTQGGSPYTGTATAKNAADDAQTVSIWTFSVDATAPAAPTIASVNGDATSPALGNDPTPPIVVSGLVAGDTVRVYEGGTVLANAVVPVGATQVTFNGTPAATDVILAPDGDHALMATSTDPAQNTSAASAVFTYTLDTASGPAPTITSVNSSTSSPASGNDPTPAIVVSTVSAGDTVRILEGETVIASKVVPAPLVPGPASVTFNALPADTEVTLTEGPHTLTADATDPAGNRSSTSVAFVYTLNTALPATPTIASVNGMTPSPAVGNDLTPAIVVSGVTAGHTVRIHDGTALKATKVAPAGGTATFNAAPADAEVLLVGGGDHSLTATVTDLDANVSGASGAFIYTLDTGATAPALVATSPANASTVRPQTISATYDERLNRTTSTISVTNGFGNAVGGTKSFSADAKTIIFTASPLTQAGNVYTATAVVRDGNANTTTSTWTFSIDTTSPAVPTIASVQGDTTTPAAGNDATPAIVVSGVVAGDTVRILEGATVRGTKTVPAAAATVTFNGGGSDTDVVLVGDGPHTLTATSTDPVGNVSAPSAPFVYTLDSIFTGEFHSFSPVRILDTRNGTGGISAPVGPAATVDVAVAGRGGVPATGVSAVVLNVAVTQPTAGGFLTVFPTGTTRPNTSSLNFAANQTAPNMVVAKVGTGGKVSVFNQAGTTHVIFDVAGWFSDATGPVGSRYNPLNPTRILDTRTGTGGFSAPVGPDGTISVPVTGVGGVPATGVSAVVVDVAVTQPTTGGYLTVFPSGTARPFASSQNFAAGETRANLVVTRVGADGKASIYNQAGTTHVIFDVVGWFGADGAVAGASYNPLNPARILDTRTGTGGFSAAVGPDGTISVPVTGVGGVPATGVSAVVINVAVTQPSAGGYLTVFPSGTTRPNASSLNFGPGQTIANLVMAKVGSDGKVSVYNQAGTSHVIFDVVGWYTG